ncbi:MAG: S9 family peptidase [Isosphaeraceae bacterium]
MRARSHRTWPISAALLVGLTLVLVPSSPALAGGRAITVDDLLAVKGVSDPQPSPDGKQVVYVVNELDRESGKSTSSLWLVATAGGEPRRLTTTPGVNNHPRWSPDGKSLAFVSTRGGSAQVWILPLEGGEARALTHLPIDVSGPIWSPQGDRLAVTAEVYPGSTPEQTAAKDKARAASKSQVRVYDHLMFRHWNVWDEEKRSHLFVVDAKSGETKDLTPDLDVNTPPAPFGGSNDYAWSPDGTELAFTAEPARKELAWSTNTDIWTVPASGAPKNVTVSNPGADGQPAYSPDGKWLAYVRQVRGGFEADLWVLTVQTRAEQRPFELTRKLDRPIQSFAWAGKQRLIATIDDMGTEPVVEVSFDVVELGGITRAGVPSDFPRLVTGGVNTAAQQAGADGPIVFVHGSADRPGEIHAGKGGDGSGKPLTHHNDPLLASLDVAKAEGFSFKGADDDTVHGWLIKPPGFDASKKYPVSFLIHGGPQGAWHDEWHARWNYAMFASHGHVVVAINPRGSTGYGQKFTDQISRDWTGRVYDDLMKGLDHALKAYPYLDGSRMAAAGGSYGGFMVNWIAGHSDRFKALVSHAGVFDLASKYGTTEELWFPEWEFGGPPWEQAEHYRERSPSQYVGNFKTPTLVVHGALDFRVSEGQGFGMFTSLQRRGVPSRLVLFPDEGHWILKPANRLIWWNEVLGWIDQYTKK